MKTREIIENLYYEKKDFIIVGLTGRTGSGCSEAANLLSKDFVELNPVVPKSRDFNSKKERQYNILYKYAKKIGENSIKLKFLILLHLLY